jgi:proteasome lid subunit RPN8/RPN11
MGSFRGGCIIKITLNLFARLAEYCISQIPNEACGVLYGVIEKDHIYIKQFTPVANVAKRPDIHFEFEREHFIRLLYEPNDSEISWVGVFHSHPLTAAYPSAQDLQLLWDLPVYAIISLELPGQPVLKSYEITAGTQKKPNSIKEQAIEMIME